MTQDYVEEGRQEMAAGRALLHDIGDRISWAGSSMVEAETELAAGNPGRADEVLAEGQKALTESAETGFLGTVVAMRAQAVLALGRDDEALRLSEETCALAARDDFDPRARAQFVQGVVLARRGDFAGADELVAAAAALIEPTDYAILHLDLAFARAEVAQLAGRVSEAREALEHALALAEGKGSVLGANRARGALEAL